MTKGEMMVWAATYALKLHEGINSHSASSMAAIAVERLRQAAIPDREVDAWNMLEYIRKHS